jgi:hypothetical protein
MAYLTTGQSNNFSNSILSNLNNFTSETKISFDNTKIPYENIVIVDDHTKMSNMTKTNIKPSNNIKTPYENIEISSNDNKSLNNIQYLQNTHDIKQNLIIY